MIVGIFGCSFSGDDNEGAVTSWPQEFAKLNPTYEVYNFACGGTSLQFSAENLQHFKKRFPNSKTIFQVTTPFRFTYKTNEINIFDCISKKFENYYSVLPEILNPNLQRFTGSNGKGKYNTKSIFKFYQNKCFYNQYEILEFSAVAEKLKNQTDCIFTHLDVPELEGYFSIQSNCSTQEWQTFVLDEYGHFNMTGSIWQANLLNEMLHENK